MSSSCTAFCGIPPRFNRFRFCAPLYKLFAVNLTGVPFVRFSTYSTANRAGWILRVYRGLISAERTVAAVMDGLDVRCDSANLRLLSRVCRNKIERKFLVPLSAQRRAKNPPFDAALRNVILCAKSVFSRYWSSILFHWTSSKISRDIANLSYTVPLPSYRPLSLQLLASHFALRCRTLSFMSLSR